MFFIPFLLLLGCPSSISNSIGNITKQESTSTSRTATKLERSDIFSSEVRWTCTDKFVEIRVYTSEPFHGIANVAGTRSMACTVEGTGKLVTDFRLNWEPDARYCGFYKNGSSYDFEVEVHQFAGLIQDHDSTFHLSCTPSDNTVSEVAASSQETLLEDDALIAVQNNSLTRNQSGINDKKQPSSASHIVPNYRLELNILKSIPDMVENLSSLPMVEFGRSYVLVANLIPFNIKTAGKVPAFRVHSCSISPAEDLDTSQKVEVIDFAGCAVKPSLLSSFEYRNDGQNFAFSHIPSIFRFPDSKALNFRCSFELCQETELCETQCNQSLITSGIETPYSDHSREDLEEIAELLGSGLDESEDDKQHLTDISEKRNHSIGNNISSTTNKPSKLKTETQNKKAKISSVVVHVMEKLGSTESTPTTKATTTTEVIPTIADGVDLTAKPPSCITPADVLLLYKLCIGLCFLFVLGCCCNIVFCCMSKGFPWNRKNNMKCKKRMAVSTSFQHQYPFSSPVTTCTTANGHRYGTLPSSKGEFWIQDTTARESNGGTPYYSSHYTDLPLTSSTSKDNRRGSLSSYASVKQRGSVVPSNRMHESLHSHFRLSNAATSDGVTIRPYSQATSSISPSVSGGGLRSTATTVYDPLAYTAPASSTTTFLGSTFPAGSAEPPASSSLSTATTNSVGGSSLTEEDDSFSRHASSPVPTSNRNSCTGTGKPSSASPPIELSAANCSSFSTTHRPAPPPPSASVQPYQSFKGASPTEYEMMPPGVNVGTNGEDRRQSYSIL